MKKINAFSTLFFSTYPYSSSCQSRLRNRHVNHISQDKNSPNLISQQQILAIHGSRKNPLPPSEYCSMILLQIKAVLRIGHWYRNHNYSDFFISVIQSCSSLPKGTQATGTRLAELAVPPLFWPVNCIKIEDTLHW